MSHDRAFLNNVVTSTIVFEDGGVREYVGGYDDWLRQRASRPIEKPAGEAARASAAAAQCSQRRRPAAADLQRAAGAGGSARDDQRNTRREIEALHRDMAQPQFYQQPGAKIAEEQARLKLLERDLAAAYAQWEAWSRLPHNGSLSIA